ncbi:MAG: tetratricopeptide repeat protein [bacterium]
MKRLGIILLILVASALITQGFQCASREMTTAKVKYKVKDWTAVKEALNEELSKRPTNEEAKRMLADVLKNQNDIPGLITFIKKNQATFVDPVQKPNFQAFVSRFWMDLFDKSNKYYIKYEKDANQVYLDSAIICMTYVYELRPELAAVSSYISEYYRIAKNDAKMIEFTNKYFDALKPDLDFATKKGFRLNSPRGEVLRALGKPTSTEAKRSTRTDSTYLDKFNVDGNEVIVHSISNKSHTAQVDGWRTNAPDYWHPEDKIQLLPITIEPFNSLILYYYDKADYTTALECAKRVLNIVPDNKRINALIIELYQKLNKVDDAIASLNEQLAKEPKNTFALGQLGDIYRVTEQYDKSIEAYKKAIEIDPKFTAATLNLATSYKNKAGVIQAKQIQESEKDPKFIFKPQEYEPFLVESAKYYTKVLETPAFENDLGVYKELINIYLVLNDKEKLAKAVTKIEGLESEAKDKELYYLDMLRIYGAMKNTEKMDATKAKLDALPK